MRFSSVVALPVLLMVSLPQTAAAEPLPSAGAGGTQLAQNGGVPRGALMRWCATLPDRFRTPVFERRCAQLKRADRGTLREACTRMPLHWQSARMQRRCSFIVGRPPNRGGDDGTGIDEGGGRFGVGRCNVRNVKLVVSTRGCSPKARRLNFRRPFLRPGESVVGVLKTGTIGKGYSPWGVCNFHTRLKYQCVRGRIRIVAVYECRQAKSGARGANCRIQY